MTPDRDRRGLGGDRGAAARGAGGAAPATASRLALGLERKLYGGPAPDRDLRRAAHRVGGHGRRGAAGSRTSRRRAPRRCAPSWTRPPARRPRPSVELRDWMRDVYAPAVEGAPDTVGRERYARWSRYFNGTDLDLDEAYAYGWAEYHRLLAEMKPEAAKILPGAGTPWEALRAPRRARQAHRGRRRGPRLAAGPDGRGDRGTGRHALRTRRAGHARWSPGSPRPAARRPRTTPAPSEDFSRPGRTWLPTMGADPLPGVRPGLDLVPRGRPRPSPPARAVGARRRRASPATRPRSAGSAPTPRAGRCTRSG